MKQCLSMALVALMLVGCQSGPKTVVKDVPKTPAAAGWNEYDRPDAGFYVAAPQNWRLTRPRATSGMTDENGNPIEGEEPANEASEEDLASQKEKGQFLVLFDNNARPTIGEAMTQIQISREDVGGIDVAGAEARAKDKVRTDGTVKTITLPIGEAVEGKMQYQNQGGDTILEIYYLVPNGSDLWTFKCLSVNNPSAFDQAILPMLETLRLTPKL